MSEKSQLQKVTYLHLYDILDMTIIDMENKSVVARG